MRGPQGTLFGRNSPAGVIKFESAKPTRYKEGYFSLSYGTYDTVNAEGALNMPINDEWAARVSLQSQRRSDWVDNTAPNPKTKELEGYKDTAARVQVLYKPSKDVSALFNVHGRDMTGSARLFRANMIEKGTNNLVSNVSKDRISIDGTNKQELTNYGGSVRLRWELNAISLHSITGYETVDSLSRGGIDGGFGAAFLAPTPSGFGLIPFPAESADGLPKHQQYTQELRAESNYKTPLNWIAGLYYFNEDLTIDCYNYDTLGGGVQNGFAQQTQENTAHAAFGSLIYQATDQLKIRGGVRYTDDSKDFTALRTQSPIDGGAIGPLTANPSDTNFSWDLSATYAVDKDTNLYARVATGFRAPSIQGHLLFGNTLSTAKSEKVTSYEAGIKQELYGRRARVGFNVFSYTVKDQQLTAVGGTANFNTYWFHQRTANIWCAI